MRRPRCALVRPATLAAAALAVGALAAACSSTHPSAQSTTSTGGAGSTSSSSTSSSSTPAGGPTHCPAADLSVSVLGTQGAAGTIEVTFLLKNSSPTTCTLQGYPGAQLYDSAGAALPTTVVRGGTYSFTNFAPAPVTLAPGASAYVNMGYSDVGTSAGACPTASSLWFTPPDAVDHAVVSARVVACDGKLTTSPVFGQGSPETQTTAPPHP